MPCTPVKMPGGATAIVCTRGRSKSCSACGRPADRLCDFPVERSGRRTTCDRPICRRCSRPISGDRDLCRPHAGLWDDEHDRPTVGPAA